MKNKEFIARVWDLGFGIRPPARRMWLDDRRESLGSRRITVGKLL